MDGKKSNRILQYMQVSMKQLVLVNLPKKNPYFSAMNNLLPSGSISFRCNSV